MIDEGRGDAASASRFGVLVVTSSGVVPASDLDEASPFGTFALQAFGTEAPEAAEARWDDFDAVVVFRDRPTGLDGAPATRGVDPVGDIDARVAPAFEATAVLIVERDPSPANALAWLQRGAQDVIAVEGPGPLALALRLRFAIERKRRERSGRRAYATDVATGLPHRQQLVEHMSHLLALREREPSPMAVLVLRIEGLATTGARFGATVADVLRRRVGVRLRAGVRASDVVSALGAETFAVLLETLLAPDDAQRVGEKLGQSLLKPFNVGGNDVTVAVALGISHYPQDGKEPERLLRRAAAFAEATPAQGRSGFANFDEQPCARDAANDD